MDHEILLKLLGERAFAELFDYIEQYSDEEDIRTEVALLRGDYQTLNKGRIHVQYDSEEKGEIALGKFSGRVGDFIKKISEGSVAINRRYPQFEKFIYIKAIHWTKQEEGKKPVYTRYLPHLEKEVAVFDELMYLRMNRLSSPYGSEEKPFKSRDRSSGTVSIRNLSPWCAIQNTDEIFENLIDQSISLTSPQEAFLLEATFYNGFQKGEEDVGAQIEYGCQLARMLVDFSSIPYFKNTLILGKSPVGKRIISKGNFLSLEVNVVSETGIYMLEAKNLKEGEKIILDFKSVIDWNLVP